MMNFATNHPLLTIYLAVILVIVMIAILRGSIPTGKKPKTVDGDRLIFVRGYEPPPSEAGPFGRPRIPMHNRFMPEDDGLFRADAMAAQIVADQQAIPEKPGRPAPWVAAPGERGYHAPTQSLNVKVDAFTVLLDRGEVSCWRTASAWGTEGPFHRISSEYDPLVTALAYEVAALRIERDQRMDDLR